jgi:hypothetical protein
MVKVIYRKVKALIKYSRLLKSWGSFRRLQPFSRVFGYDRGNQSVARYYIDNFISDHASVITGKVLEIGDDTYTKRFGNDVTHSDVLHVREGNPKATIVTDLTCDIKIADETYDCIIMPQTFQFIYDMRAALFHAHRILKNKGVLLATFSGISQISRYDMERWGDYWRVTSLSCKILFEEFFETQNIKITSYGNVLAAVGFLEGLASRELKKNEMDYHDPDYEVIISVVAIKN